MCIRDRFSGSGEASGSSYIVSVDNDVITFRRSDEVIDGLDTFFILPEGTLAQTAFPPTFVSDGGPSYSAENTLSMNTLLQNTGTWDGKSYGYGNVDFSGSWASNLVAGPNHVAGSWTQAAVPLTVVSTGFGPVYRAENENDAIVRSFSVVGDAVTSDDYSWAGTHSLASAPTLTGPGTATTTAAFSSVRSR